MSEGVLIAGAGPVGLALAIGLKLQGVQAVVVDRATGPKREPRAAVVWPRTAEALAGWGLGPALAAEALPLDAAHVHVRGRPRGALRFGGLPGVFSRPLVIEQHAVERLLLNRYLALGGEVRWGVALEAVELSAENAMVRLAGRETTRTATFDWVVGCEGARSIVRRDMGVAFRGRARPDVVCLQANARPRWRFPHRPGEGRFFLGHDATLGAFATPDGDHRLYVFKRDDDPGRGDEPTLGELEMIARRLTGDADLRLDPPANPWLNFARFQQRVAERLRVGRALLCGDAAHVWPAVGGHGMAVGVAGARRLAHALASVIRGGAAPQLLDAYDHAQRRLARRTIALSNLDVLERPNGAAALAMLDAALPTLLGVPAVAHGVERLMASLSHPIPDLASAVPPLASGARV